MSPRERNDEYDEEENAVRDYNIFVELEDASETYQSWRQRKTEANTIYVVEQSKKDAKFKVAIACSRNALICPPLGEA